MLSKIVQIPLSRAVCLRLACSMGLGFVVILLGGSKKNQENMVGVKIGAAEGVSPVGGWSSLMSCPMYLGTTRGGCKSRDRVCFLSLQ